MALYTTNNRRLNEILHSSKGSTFTTGLLTLLVVAAMILFAIVPAYSSISDKLANNELKQTYLDELIQKKSNMDQLLVEYDEKSELIKLFEETTFTRNNNELLLANFNDAAIANNITILNVSFDKVEAPEKEALTGFPNLLSQNFSYTTKAKPQDQLALIKYLEKFPIPNDFESVSFNFETDTALGEIDTELAYNGDSEIEMNLTGRYYFWDLSSDE